jgi:hypothetical protein
MEAIVGVGCCSSSSVVESASVCISQTRIALKGRVPPRWAPLSIDAFSACYCNAILTHTRHESHRLSEKRQTLLISIIWASR